MLVPLFLLLLLALPGNDRTASDSASIEPIGRLDHAPIKEASGLVASRRHPGIFWVHNDSGNPPALYAVHRDGKLVREYQIGAPNLDWEDLASDEAGHLYIGDIGNNNGRLPLRAIYRIDEPDPERQDGPGRLAVNRSWYYRFPPSGRFDAEGLFIDGPRMVLVAKTFDGREAELYALALEARGALTAPIVPERLGVLPGFVEPATGAALAADGLRLAVCSARAVRVYGRKTRALDRWTLLATVTYQADNVEAITWDGADLIVANEDRGLYRIAATVWQAATTRTQP